jgi:Cytochrome oxidase complex assembly protein 1
METAGEKPRSWLRAHWKLVLAVWLGLALSGAVAAFVLMSNSEVVKLALSVAESNPMLAERLGQPLKRGWLVSGSVEVTPASGHAELAIPVSGPKGSGTLYAQARKRAGLWHLEDLQFGSEGSSERLDLLAPDKAAKPTATPQR